MSLQQTGFIPLGFIYPVVGSLDHAGFLFSILGRMYLLFPTSLTVETDIPVNSVSEFPFLHVLTALDISF